MICLDLGLYSIVGKRRKIDEDSVLAISYESSSQTGVTDVFLCALADGMGGGERGDVASQLALESFSKCTRQFFLDGLSDPSRIKKEMINAVNEANAAVNDYRMKNRIDEMGTTLTAAYVYGGYIYVVNVGDSRTYVLNNGKVQKKTKDHSYVQELVDVGAITSDQARQHPRRNEITRVIGIGDHVDIDYYEWRIFKDDSILLCCDGFWEALGDDLVAQFASKDKSAADLVKEMIDKANELDGTDNISAVFFRPSLQSEVLSTLQKTTERRQKQGVFGLGGIL